jgi:valyl-tRNA synthetase
MKNLLLLLAPITPFIVDKIWTELYSTKSVHLEQLPKASWPRQYKRYTAKILTFNREAWKMKKDKGLALRDPLEMQIPKALATFRGDLTRMHSLTTKT